MHWGINYLREDIQDQRAEMRSGVRQVRNELRDHQAESAAVRQEMQRGLARLDSKIDSRFHLLLGATITLNGMLAALMTALIRL